MAGKQGNFLGKLFSKPKKPLDERIKRARLKIIGLINANKKSVEATQKYLEINRTSMGSSERVIEERDLESTKKRISNLNNRLKKVNAIEKNNLKKKILSASKKRKLLVLPRKKLIGTSVKQNIVEFVKDVSLNELRIVCSQAFAQDWEMIVAHRKDILKWEKGRSKSFVKSSNQFFHDIYRISQELVVRGNEEQKKYGLELFDKIDKFAKNLK